MPFPRPQYSLDDTLNYDQSSLDDPSLALFQPQDPQAPAVDTTATVAPSAPAPDFSDNSDLQALLAASGGDSGSELTGKQSLTSVIAQALPIALAALSGGGAQRYAAAAQGGLAGGAVAAKQADSENKYRDTLRMLGIKTKISQAADEKKQAEAAKIRKDAQDATFAHQDASQGKVFDNQKALMEERLNTQSADSKAADARAQAALEARSHLGVKGDTPFTPEIVQQHLAILQKKDPTLTPESIDTPNKLLQVHRSLRVAGGGDNSVKDGTAKDLALSVSYGKNIKAASQELADAITKEPQYASYGVKDILTKVPNNSPVYNAAQKLRLLGLGAAKQLEGRVNETVLKTYGDFMTPASTESIGNALQRANFLSDIFFSNAQTSSDVLKSLGRNVGGLDTLITGSKSPAPLTRDQKIEELRQRGLVQ